MLTVVGGLAAAVVAVVVGPADDGAPTVVAATDPVAALRLPDGRVAFGERTTGEVRVLDDDGGASTLARVPDELATEGQRGLLGLAAADGEDGLVLWASWVRAEDGRLVVGRLLPAASSALVWEGPVTTRVANGGTLAVRGDELLVGVGELQDPAAVPDPATPNGKVLALDPSGPSDQVPSVVAGGWHNPFALTVLDGEVWIADNAPGDDPERLARVGVDGTVDVVDLDGRRAPSSLADDGAGGLVLCGFVSGLVERLEVPVAGAAVRPSVLAGTPEAPACRTGALVVGDELVSLVEDGVVRRSLGDR